MCGGAVELLETEQSPKFLKEKKRGAGWTPCLKTLPSLQRICFLPIRGIPLLKGMYTQGQTFLVIPGSERIPSSFFAFFVLFCFCFDDDVSLMSSDDTIGKSFLFMFLHFKLLKLHICFPCSLLSCHAVS